jgi:signal transduction histidine kinase
MPLARAIGELGHELANPLNAIAITNELAKRMLARGQHERVAQALETIGADCERCARLLRDAQEYMSMEPRERRDVLDIAALLDEVVRSQGERGEVQTHAPPDGYRPEGDARAVRRLFSEVLRNAFDHGAHHVQIEISHDAGELYVRVGDDGPGVDPALLPRIFDPFFSTARQRHSGLGLAIARDIAQAHGGDVDVEPAERGMVFRVRLPARAS